MINELLDKLVTVPDNKVVIRFTTFEDLPQVARIARITWDATYNQTIAPENRREFLTRAYRPENLEDAITSPGHWFYVAQQNNRVVGFGHFLERYHPNRKRAELVRLYILPEFQNMGIGRQMLKTGFAHLTQAGIEQCCVSVQSANMTARQFYERQGFKLNRTHGQFLGTQIITLVEYTRPISANDLSI